MSNTLIRIAKVVFIGFWALSATALLLFTVVSLVRLNSTFGRETVITAPSGKWSLALRTIEYTSRSEPRAKLIVHRGPMANQELICDVSADGQGAVFNDITSSSWQNDDLTLAWQSGSPPSEGIIDIATACSDTAAFDDRMNRIGLRFHENCLVGGCRRWVAWTETVGNETITTPCRTTQEGDTPIFTRSGDPRGQIDVQLDAKARIADWKNRNTGESGRIEFSTDCDISRQTRKPQPA